MTNTAYLLLHQICQPFQRLPPVKRIFLGPKPKLADFLVQCYYIIKFYFTKIWTQKVIPVGTKTQKPKKFTFFQMDAVFRSKGQMFPSLTYICSIILRLISLSQIDPIMT